MRIVAAAAVVATAVALWPTGPSAPVAHAGWVPHPTLVALADLSPWIEQACASEDPDTSGHAGEPAFDDVQPVLAERRGDVVLLLQAGSTGWTACVQPQTGWGGSLAHAATTPLDALDTVASLVVTTQSHTPAAGRGGIAWTSVLLAAQVDRSVARAEVVLATGFRVEATVTQGYLAAWWPLDGATLPGDPADLGELVLRDDAGNVLRTITLSG
ncbi:MAG: hypothetical protein BGO96_06325 [Micrococcales bacterium 73-15]|nr:MAG: hypothetical protein BGO96_06325 [Micrococcales bacterium 73-15]